jgi:putative transposase
MPNYMHGIIWLKDDRRGTACRAPTPNRIAYPVEQFGKPTSRSLSTIVGSYKSAVTRRIRTVSEKHTGGIWQRGYYEHVIRDDTELRFIREYILNNPSNWSMDAENPDRHKSNSDRT